MSVFENESCDHNFQGDDDSRFPCVTPCEQSCPDITLASSANTDDDVALGGKRTKLKRSEKKILRHEHLLAKRKSERKDKKIAARTRKAEQRRNESQQDSDVSPSTLVSKKQLKAMTRQKCSEALHTGQRVCVDLSLQQHMSGKEISKLAQQLCRLYGANRKADKPCHVYFTGLDEESGLYRECVRKNEGFENYLIEMTKKSCLDVFANDEIVYLSPDSENVLEIVDESCVYVIGGLVDESVKKRITQTKAADCDLRTARLPIDEYMSRTAGSSHSPILTVNQVFEILLTFCQCRDWRVALLSGVPPRKGFVLREEPSEHP